MKRYMVKFVAYYPNTSGAILCQGMHDFNNKTDAENFAYYLAMNELENICGLDEDGYFPELRFVPTTQNPEHFLVINAWDGEDYYKVSTYDIVEL